VILAVEYLNHMAHKSINDNILYTLHYGDTVDISVLPFHFWQPIEYLEPTISFPEEHMLPGRWLSIARLTGNEFTYYIVPEGEPKDQCRSIPIMCSMICSCTIDNKEHDGSEHNMLPGDLPAKPTGTDNGYLAVPPQAQQMRLALDRHQ